MAAIMDHVCALEWLEVVGAFDQATAHEEARKLLQRPDRPTAIVSISNMMTVGTLFAIRELALSVPDEVSVVGIDDLDFAPLLHPVPTVVETPILPMSRQAIELLLSQIAGKTAPRVLARRIGC